MKLTIITVASLGLFLAAFVLPARADWHYLIRTTGLGWSDGYHAYDQCPPKQKHFHQHMAPSNGQTYAPSHEPYYFELNNKQQETEMLPAAPDNAAPAAPTPATAPNPQAQYKPRSRYFQALEQNSQQPLQARQPGFARPYS